MQLMAAWFLARVLSDLTARDVKAQKDINGVPKAAKASEALHETSKAF
jgi:hypothetical protein